MGLRTSKRNRPRRRARLLLVGALLGLLLWFAAPHLVMGQTPGPESALPDPEQIRGQASQTLVRLVVDRPRSQYLQAVSVATEASLLAAEITVRLAGGQGPNGGPLPSNLDLEVAQAATTAAACRQKAEQNVELALQDLELLRSLFGGRLELESEPSPETALGMLQWVGTLGDRQRARNQAIDQCLQESLLGLGRLRAYRSLYPS